LHEFHGISSVGAVVGMALVSDNVFVAVPACFGVIHCCPMVALFLSYALAARLPKLRVLARALLLADCLAGLGTEASPAAFTVGCTGDE
jgi:hypothetical protein